MNPPEDQLQEPANGVAPEPAVIAPVSIQNSQPASVAQDTTESVHADAGELKLYRRILILSLALWAIALLLPAFVSAEGAPTFIPGYSAFATGAALSLFLFIASPTIGVAWFANIAWLVGILKLGKYLRTSVDDHVAIKMSKKTSGGFTMKRTVQAKIWFSVASVMAMAALIPTSIMFENENDIRSANIGIGGVLWILSMVVPLVIMLLHRPLSQVTKEGDKPVSIPINPPSGN